MVLEPDHNLGESEDAKDAGVDVGYSARPGISGDRHKRFRELCVVYGDSCRQVFLDEFVMWFVRFATKSELGRLSREIATQSRRIDQNRKPKGRPRAEDLPSWLGNARDAAFKRIVYGWSWARIARSEGKKPSKPNIQTLKNRQDRYAGIIWEVCSETGVWQSGSGTEADIVRLRNSLETTMFRMVLCRRALLPFSIFRGQDLTAECEKVVMTLAPQGGKIVGRQFVRWLDRLSKHRKRDHSPTLK
jgi:hypothetical protein